MTISYSEKLFYSVALCNLIIFLNTSLVWASIIWNSNKPNIEIAKKCDFQAPAFETMQANLNNCGSACLANVNCSHFVWLKNGHGTCFLKNGTISKAEALESSDPSSFCGIIKKTRIGAIQWNVDQLGINWALGCDFENRDLTNKITSGDQCGPTCMKTPPCSHFSWTNWNGGTCWMKSGQVSKLDAFSSSIPSAVCGFLTQQVPGTGIGPILSNVLATNHQAKEVGACSLPEASYTVTNPVALGNIQSLSHLKFNSNLCGHIFEIDCGNGKLDIIVTNANLGGGLDLYASSWNKATKNKPPGEAFCKVQLTSKNPFTSSGYKCFHATAETSNNWYRKVGLLNTNEKLVTGATFNGITGRNDGFSPYYEFNGFGTSNDLVKFFFNDGSSFSIALSSCESGANKHMWS